MESPEPASCVKVKAEPRPQTLPAEEAPLVKTEPSEIDRSETASSQDTVAAVTEWFRNMVEDSELDMTAEEESPVEPTPAPPPPPPPARCGPKRGKRGAKFSCTLCPFVTKRKAGMVLHLKKHKRAASLHAAPSQTKERNESENDSTEGETASKDADASPSAKATPKKTLEKSNGRRPSATATPKKTLDKGNGQRGSSESRAVVDSEPVKETAPSQSHEENVSDEDTDSATSAYDSNKSLHEEEGRKSPQFAQRNYKSRVSLAHLARIKEPLQLRCHVCPFTTKYQATLFLHIKGHADKDKKLLACQFCSYTTKFKNQLVTHVKLHTGERPYKCTECSRAYTDRSSLVAHLRVHTGERLYKCNICPREFNEKPRLRRHVQSKHAGSERVQTT